mgnify:CR=1 FL=1
MLVSLIVWDGFMKYNKLFIVYHARKNASSDIENEQGTHSCYEDDTCPSNYIYLLSGSFAERGSTVLCFGLDSLVRILFQVTKMKLVLMYIA